MFVFPRRDKGGKGHWNKREQLAIYLPGKFQFFHQLQEIGRARKSGELEKVVPGQQRVSGQISKHQACWIQKLRATQGAFGSRFLSLIKVTK